MFDGIFAVAALRQCSATFCTTGRSLWFGCALKVHGWFDFTSRVRFVIAFMVRVSVEGGDVFDAMFGLVAARQCSFNFLYYLLTDIFFSVRYPLGLTQCFAPVSRHLWILYLDLCV